MIIIVLRNNADASRRKRFTKVIEKRRFAGCTSTSNVNNIGIVCHSDGKDNSSGEKGKLSDQFQYSGKPIVFAICMIVEHIKICTLRTFRTRWRSSIPTLGRTISIKNQLTGPVVDVH